MEQKMENPAETVLKVLEKFGSFEALTNAGDTAPDAAHLITLPQGRSVHNLTEYHRQAAEYFKPARRRGTAHLEDLQSLIDWTNRFKGSDSAMFADPDIDAPSLMTIADYHAGGPANPAGDDSARHCNHRAIYAFPVSKEWQAWTEISGVQMEKDDLGEFIESHAKDIMDPTPAILQATEDDANEGWENRLIRMANQIEGRFGQLHQLLAMSRRFQVHQTSNLDITSNRDTGEASLQFLDEHKGVDGKPLNIPNLIIIAIPVFKGGDLFRMPVRFRYRKSGSSVRFILSVYNPERAFDAALDDAIQRAVVETELPLFMGSPEE